MKTIREQLLDMIEEPDVAFNQRSEDLLPMQLAAANEVFTTQRAKIPLLDSRAEEAGISTISNLDELVPLLFPHTAYKSYPQSFFDKGQWSRMQQWLDTLSAVDVMDVDLSAVNNVDQWLETLWEAGHLVLATSGTSGKCSFINRTRNDRALTSRHFYHAQTWPFLKPVPRPMFWLGPGEGHSMAIESVHITRKFWGIDGDFHVLTKKPLLISEVSHAAALRKRIAQGVATPSEIGGLEAEMKARAVENSESLVSLANQIIDRRHEPLHISGQWAQHLQIVNIARDRGIPDGDFNPQTVLNIGGGVKGIALPDDYRERVNNFYGDVIKPANYGMTETAQIMSRCEKGHYHAPPGLIWMALDGAGERRLGPEDANSDNLVEGRFAFLDLLFEGHWGGLITGDRVTVDFSPLCSCGRPGPTLLDNIVRFVAPGQGEDDHIGCAGTIDSYIRGSLS